jgi:putative glycosyltransferase (TIGR04372 family)
MSVDRRKPPEFVTRSYALTLRLRDRLVSVAVLLVTLVEAPVFLFRNRRMFGNGLICLFWAPSFGHTVSGIDFTSRLFYPNRIALIYLPSRRTNSYLAHCFEHNVDPFVYSSIIPPRSTICDRPRATVLRVLLHLVLSIKGRTDPWASASALTSPQLIDPWASYKALGLANNQLLVGREGPDVLDPTPDWTGYIRLLREQIGERPRLPQHMADTVRAAIVALEPAFFERPFAVLLLRGKGRGEVFDTAFRDAGPHENYLPAVELLTARGYHVAPQGETAPETFSHVPGFFDLRACACPPELLNLFLLSEASLFIGQQSGPMVLASSCRIPVVLCDALPHRLGTFLDDDLVLFKTLRDAEGRALSLDEIYLDRSELAFGCGFAAGGVVIGPNTPDQIVDAVRERLDLIEGRIDPTAEEEELCGRFRSLLSPRMMIAYQGTRPPLAMLRDPELGIRSASASNDAQQAPRPTNVSAADADPLLRP